MSCPSARFSWTFSRAMFTVSSVESSRTWISSFSRGYRIRQTASISRSTT